MRQSGYYWVKHNGKWIIAEYAATWNGWWMPGEPNIYENGEFNEIDETQITRK
jgi:hypothetical protein